MKNELQKAAGSPGIEKNVTRIIAPPERIYFSLDFHSPSVQSQTGFRGSMARLLIKTGDLKNQTLELRLGVNRVGRDPGCDFPIEHSTVSSIHCELVLSSEGVLIRDCNSTNGTFVNDEPVKEAWLRAGQTVRMGDVELFVENTDVKVAIPKYEHERPKPPVMLEGGAMLCPRHPRSQVTYKCTHCKEVMCGGCVRVLQRKGGPLLFLCPLCSHKCKRIAGDEKPKKKGFMEFLPVTVRLPFVFFTKGSKTKGSQPQPEE